MQIAKQYVVFGAGFASRSDNPISNFEEGGAIIAGTLGG
jgi:hypothetical protein